MTFPQSHAEPDATPEEPADVRADAEVDTEVDTALTQRLDAIAGLPLAEQADAYQEVHAELQRSLADIDAG